MQNDKKEEGLPAADTGNASNPSTQWPLTPPADDQLINEDAEKYLREGGNIEDLPDAEDQQEADKTIKETGKE